MNRLIVSIGAILLVARAVEGQTTNAVPKYDSNGNLVASTISEAGGQVGIGTPSPQDRFVVVGANNNTGLEFGNTGGNVGYIQVYDRAAAAPRPFTTYALSYSLLANGGSAPPFTINSSGNVGVGTATPTLGILDIRKSSSVTNPLNSVGFLSISNTNGGSGVATGIEMSTQAGFYSGIYTINVGTSRANQLAFATMPGDGSVPVEAVRIDQYGDVGIGTVTPGAKLHVAGDVIVDGNIAAKFQDVAEWVQARVPLADGTVVVASGAEDNVVESSAREYDGAVVGVVSPQPGIVLGESTPGAVLIAHSGRVRVKVDASYGAIRRGDALTTSPTPGYAMRSTPFDIGGVPIHRPGTLLGKALEPLESGTGEILVLLTLQ